MRTTNNRIELSAAFFGLRALILSMPRDRHHGLPVFAAGDDGIPFSVAKSGVAQQQRRTIANRDLWEELAAASRRETK